MIPRNRTPCEADPDLFDHDRSLDVDHLRRLRALCRQCPSLADCRDYTLANDVTGFAAGLTSLERRRAGAPYLDSQGHIKRREVAA